MRVRRPAGAAASWASTLALVLMLPACSAPALRPTSGVRLPIVSEVSFFESQGERIRVDVYRPAAGGRHPAALVLHGSSGIHAFVESMANRYAEVLAQQGIAAFVVH